MTDYKGLISKYESLYDQLIPEFYADEITTSGKPPVTWLNYFDLVLIAILLNKNKNVRRNIDVDIFRIAAELFILGNNSTHILQDRQVRSLIDSIVFDKPLENSTIFQILLSLERTLDTVMSIEVMYMLPLIALMNTKRFPNYIHRSNIMVIFINQFGMTRCGKDHKYDVTTDVMKIMLKLKRLLGVVMSDTSYEEKEFVEYAIDTFRIFIIAYFGSLIGRDCLYPEFKTLGKEVVHDRYLEHKNVLDKKILKPKS